MEWVLDTIPTTRNDDFLLVNTVCKHFTERHPTRNASGIERMRRHFNQHNRFLPTDWKVAEKRRMNKEAWLEALGYK